MESATCLYERLGQIPQDPEDPECMEDMLVCAFGAFERFYVCWKTKGGEFRQDGYDLPPNLRDWLFPSDGTTRDFATLQVVFGRGNEYFASDKDGKLEFKEPEVKKPVEDEDKPTMRRARTVSFLRPLSDPSTKTASPAVESPSSSRRSSSASQSASRPRSLSFSRTASDISLNSQTTSRTPNSTFSRPVSDASSNSIPTSRPSSTSSSNYGLWTSSSSKTSNQVKSNQEAETRQAEAAAASEASASSPVSASGRLARRSQPLSMSLSYFPKIVEGQTLRPKTSSPAKETTTSNPSPPAHCTCGCHSQPPPPPKPTYADASMQTDPIPTTSSSTSTSTSPPRTALRIDTSQIANEQRYSWNSNSNNNTSTAATESPLEGIPPSGFYQPAAPPPVFMGRMMDYFSNPGYQLGDSLMSSYYYYEQQQQQQQQKMQQVQ